MIKPHIHKALMKSVLRGTHKRYQTGCVIVNKKGVIISTGCSHSSHMRMSELHSIHAEIHALATGRHEQLKGCKAYVLTMARKSQNFTFSRPCLTCAIALYTAGIEEVIYHNGENHPMKHQWNYAYLDELIEKSNLKVYSRRKKNVHV